MQNHNKQDKIFVNNITEDNKVIRVPQKDSGNAGKDPFCVYDHKRHAVGSKLTNEDGSTSVCSEDGSWENKK